MNLFGSWVAGPSKETKKPKKVKHHAADDQHFWLFCLETGSHYVAQADLGFTM